MVLIVLSALTMIAGCAPMTKPSAQPSTRPSEISAPPPTPTSAPAPATDAPPLAEAPTPPPPAPVAPPAPIKPLPKASQPDAIAKPAPVVAVAKPKPPVDVAKPKPPVVEPAAKPVVAEATPAASGTLRGNIALVAGTDQAIAASDMQDTTVYFIPDSGAAHPKPGHFRIYTRGKQFEPTTLVIPLGSTVSFPNQDEILHNVFSVSPAGSFDLGLYGEGNSADYTFTKPGLVLINCNVHRAMQANVLVLDTPYFVHPDKDGNFELSGLPAGSGKLMIWNPRAATQTMAANASSPAAIPVKLVLTKPRLVQHLNKENKSY